jgi:5'-nucleotidase
MDRRKFLQITSLSAAALALNNKTLWAATSKNAPLVIAHTNDVHSRLDPFPMDGSKLQGLGGIKARKFTLDQLRATHPDLFLFDCGDMFQGTPYFNLYKGEPEIKAMNYLAYDAGTLGNHDFDGGMENLALQLSKAQFPIVNANYDFSNTILEGKIAPYVILRKGVHKVGVIGVGIELNGLVPDALCKGIVYNNPVPVVNKLAKELKKKKCDFIVVLSHLGYDYENKNKISDKALAAATKHVDLILGGHTHTFLEKPTTVKNLEQKNVFINQVGWAGVQVGLLEFDIFQQKNNSDGLNAHSGIFVKQTSV